MRRYQVAHRPAGPLGVVVIASLLASCVLAGPPSVPSAAVGLTIQTGPGETLAFAPPEPTIVATGRVAITFENRSSLSHNLVFTGRLTAATRTIVEPGGSDHLLLSPPSAGRYPFVCTIHDGMAGTLVIRASEASDPAS